MTARELKEWADVLPPDAKVQFMLDEAAIEAGYTDYRSSKDKGDGWMLLDGKHLRIIVEHPDRRPAQVAERLSK